MNRELEEIIVRAFVMQSRRERILFELGKENKRGRAIWNLRHHLEPIFMKRIETSVSDDRDVLKIMREYGAPPRCYVMTERMEDSKERALEEALKEYVFAWPVLLSCVPGKIAYFVTEGCGKSNVSEKYVLIKKV